MTQKLSPRSETSVLTSVAEEQAPDSSSAASYGEFTRNTHPSIGTVKKERKTNFLADFHKFHAIFRRFNILIFCFL
jgi:hypothetical protein